MIADGLGGFNMQGQFAAAGEKHNPLDEEIPGVSHGLFLTWRVLLCGDWRCPL